MNGFSLENTRERRASRVSVDFCMDEDPSPTPSPYAPFQERYQLTGTIACTFWAHRGQLEQAHAKAKQVLLQHLYRDAIGVLHDIELAVEELDQDQLRRACMDMRDIFTGKNT